MKNKNKEKNLAAIAYSTCKKKKFYNKRKEFWMLIKLLWVSKNKIQLKKKPTGKFPLKKNQLNNFELILLIKKLATNCCLKTALKKKGKKYLISKNKKNFNRPKTFKI